MNGELQLAIGKELEDIRFPRLRKGKAQFVPFVQGAPEEVAPIIEGIAEARGVSVDEVQVIAAGVQMAADIRNKFPESTMDFQSFVNALTPEVLRKMEDSLNPQVYLLV